jgi:hypothetical protein
MATPARAALVAVSAALALGACSGSDPDAAAPLPTPVTSSAAPTSAAPSSSAASPEPGLPAGVTADITLPAAGDPARTALLRDWKAGQVAYLAAAAVPDPRSAAVARYYAQEALATTVGSLRDDAQKRRGVIGTRKIDSVTVESQTSTAATMTWCVDDSRFFARDLRTGKPIISHEYDHYGVSGRLLRDPKLRIWVLVRAILAGKGVQC